MAEDRENEDHDLKRLHAYVSSIVTALGGIDQADPQRRYILGDDALGCLKDLKKLLRQDESWTCARILTDTNVVNGDLCEILAAWTDEEVENKAKARYGLACVEPLTLLTWPLTLSSQSLRADQLENAPDIQLAQSSYKRTILSHPTHGVAVLRSIVRVALPAMAISRRERTPRDETVILLVLHLLRNLAQIDHGDSEGRSGLIMAFEKANVLDLLVALASGMGEEFEDQDVAVMECIYYLVQGVPAEVLFAADKEVTAKSSNALADLLKKEDVMKKTQKRRAPTRHNRFGTLVSVVTADNKRLTVASQDAVHGTTERGLKKLDTAKKWKKTAFRRIVDEDIDKPVTIMREARAVLRRFVEEILDSGFNPLFTSVRRAMEREKQRVLEVHRIHFPYLIAYFLEALRWRGTAAVEAAGGRDAPEVDYGLVAGVLDQLGLIMINKLMRESSDLRQWTGLHAAMDSFQQILLTIQNMAYSPSMEYQEIADNMQSNIFYEESTMDLVVHILKNYTNQSFGYMDTATGLASTMLKMLERYSKSKAHIYVRSWKKKQKKAQNTTTEAADDSEEENEVDYKKTYSERAFEFARFEGKFANEDCINTFKALLNEYAELKPDQIKRAVAFFHRIFVKRQQESLMFRLDLCELFNRIVEDKVALDEKDPARKELEQFVKYYTKKLTRKLAERPSLYVELLFTKIPKQLYYLDHGEELAPVVRAPRAPAELEVRPGFDHAKDISVLVAALLDEEKGEALDWCKSSLKSAASERQAWEAEAIMRRELEDAERGEELHASLPEAPIITLSVDEESQVKKLLFKDGKLHLLMGLIGCERLGMSGDVNAEWVIPSAVTSEALESDLTLLREYTDNPPTFDDGKTAKDFIRYKSKRVEQGNDSEESVEESDDPEAEGVDAMGFPLAEKEKAAKPKKKKLVSRKREHKELDDEELEERRVKKRKAEDEKIAAVKSALYVEDSDEDMDDAEFFAREAALREKTANAATAAIVHQQLQPNVKKSKAAADDAIERARATIAKALAKANAKEDLNSESDGESSRSSSSSSADEMDLDEDAASNISRSSPAKSPASVRTYARKPTATTLPVPDDSDDDEPTSTERAAKPKGRRVMMDSDDE
ncbi:timeless-domain-containing protein [Saitoella complicata NRRL Y-17804]|uniref:Timeless N-terminal domain-containing protein n=1 Tax=Saitoella complicata (strain BCRC 22490 / CBS 7301 / JCM 7358 / NBRC 10748 / NRRL Y-17804) TaxID=698492 RepID=A0A0E9NCD7_SAICN|nr:timeless-domain-containing protein [Saitoella complicata NRRL Y-17804]ODQ52554.1 timeless-domain-containing protein [Saitoella complicata NRRL Y-17804]GAO47499.1 hypothetical protein G7K_1705-t1 [Saitoella complicata NRRL Y-17804]